MNILIMDRSLLFNVYGQGSMVEDLGGWGSAQFKVSDLGCGVEGLGFEVMGLGHGGQCEGCRV